MAGESPEPMKEGKASRKMINVWMLRWSLGIIAMVGGFVVPMWVVFSMEFDEITGEPINFNLGEVALSIALGVIILFVISLVITRAWASLYWKRYSFEFHGDRVVITRGVIGRKITNIQYERVQNVNVWRGILERIYGISSVMIETAGGTQVQMGNYGAFSFSEGTIQGIKDPQPIVDYLMKRAKGGKDGLMSRTIDAPDLSKDAKLELLEERLLNGQISEQIYKELKAKYES